MKENRPGHYFRVPAGILGMARTLPLAHEAVVSFRTQPGGARLPGVSGLTQTHSVGVVAFAVILTATFLCAASAISTNWTFVLAPVQNKRHRNTVLVIDQDC